MTSAPFNLLQVSRSQSRNNVLIHLATIVQKPTIEFRQMEAATESCNAISSYFAVPKDPTSNQ